ncbi:MAG: hypothetical protein NTV58_18595 [Deltaproteobacteria bacterium]|nr:hypothetical protein [Deltaproteobacteria bacterium]
MNGIPKYLVLPDRVYALAAGKADGGRAFDRMLVDYLVEGTNPMSETDTWRTRLGMSRELSDDYPSFREAVPIEWVLFRFLCHFVRTNSVHVLSGNSGQVLTSTSYKDYLGHEPAEQDADLMLRTIFVAWVRVFPEKTISLADVYASTDLTINQLKRSVNALISQGHVQETEEYNYMIRPSVFDNRVSSKNSPSLDRMTNRYYQQIAIEANDPFCFVIMPFKEKEFPQKIYTDVIKPFVEDQFKIGCYRVDEDNLPDRIDNKIYSYLLRSAFVIAEVTTLNPNVFYELGLAHMLEKDCIIVTNTPIEKIPFDINRIRAEHYDNDQQLIEILGRAISALAFKCK